MSKTGAPRHDPVPIGEVATPPFVRFPGPLSLFQACAERFASLARGHELAPCLRFMAGVADTQHRIQDGLPEPDMPEADAIARAREFGMPPLDRNRFLSGPVIEATLDRLFAQTRELEMPEAARALGVPRDAKLAAEWWAKAAERGDADGQAMLGAAFHLGAGATTDRVAAFALLLRARKGGSALASPFFDAVGGTLAPHEIAEAESRAAAPLPGASP